MNDRFLALKLFARAARVGNFSSAGRELGLSQPSASRLIAALEEEVGATLFNRTTRAVKLTEAGATYLMRVEAILAAIDEADHEARGTGELRGSLRVGTSSSFVLREIIPRLPAFMKQHAALKIELVANDRYQDLVTEGIDVAFRFGALPDSSAMARKIIHLPRILMASPDYLRERGTPTVPSDLARHSVIIGPAHPSPTFSFRKDGRVTSVRVDSQLAITINEGVTASAVAGLGIVASSENSARAELEAGQLVRVLSDWDFGSMELNALFVNGKSVKPAARALADFLLKELRAAGLDARRPPSENESAGARYQGRAIAKTAAKLQG
ncbi:LysR family transcriptional regulator [Bradyrhizobium sp. 200]|uniref:LysR family transcriptional regulator n=1 Tax=Bradyrhizobium sp. 200 TaxID=2782665 RepID=UPI001FFF0A06|nr:LysR family transcriptional regulator [Bradyrhizobium sp. 200]UPJ48550.1 LysR family transcriptional regulator [Bradyrhizobium sp. 200]